MSRFRRYRCAALLMPALLLGGCGLAGPVKSVFGLGKPHAELRGLTVSADPGANQGNATELDIVVVHDASALASLPRSGPDWFRQRAALQSTLATNIEVVSLQVPGASPEFQVTLPKRTRKAIAVQAYANYAAPTGWPPIALTPYSKATLRLQETAIAVSGK